MGSAALSKGIGSDKKWMAMRIMLVLVGVDFLALMTSHAIVKARHIT